MQGCAIVVSLEGGCEPEGPVVGRHAGGLDDRHVGGELRDYDLVAKWPHVEPVKFSGPLILWGVLPVSAEQVAIVWREVNDPSRAISPEVAAQARQTDMNKTVVGDVRRRAVEANNLCWREILPLAVLIVEEEAFEFVRQIKYPLLGVRLAREFILWDQRVELPGCLLEVLGAVTVPSRHWLDQDITQVLPGHPRELGNLDEAGLPGLLQHLGVEAGQGVHSRLVLEAKEVVVSWIAVLLNQRLPDEPCRRQDWNLPLLEWECAALVELAGRIPDASRPGNVLNHKLVLAIWVNDKKLLHHFKRPAIFDVVKAYQGVVLGDHLGEVGRARLDAQLAAVAIEHQDEERAVLERHVAEPEIDSRGPVVWAENWNAIGIDAG